MAPAQDTDSLMSTRPPSVGAMFYERVTATPDREAFRYPVEDGWESMTWEQAGQRVALIAGGLIALGVGPEQRVAIASGTRYEWILADLAVMTAGGATTTVYPSTISDDVAYILGDSDSHIVFAEDDVQIAKLRDRRDELPALTKVVTFDGTPDGDWVIDLAELERMGRELLDGTPDAVTERLESIGPDDLATLIYTSGTTGRPKGVRLRHSAWTFEGQAIKALHLLTDDDLQYLWLPLSHSFGKVLLCAQLQVGFPTAVDGRVEKIIENLAVVQPTFMGAAPRIFEKAHARIVTMAANGSPVKRRIFDQAFKVGKEVSRRKLADEPVPALLAARHKVFDRLVFSKIRERFGSRLRFFVSGAAALDPEIARWFHAAGIVILEGYGLTETSAGSILNRPEEVRFGTVGRPLAGTEVRIADDGELLIRGPGVMDGYHNLDELTAESLRDGWMHTGDIGEIDDDGIVRITDRKKDLFKTSGGKYVAPQIIEGMFKAVCPYASQFVVHGNERNFVSAIVTLDPDSIGGWAEQHGLGGKSYAEIVGSDEAYAMVQGYVDELNSRLNRWEEIKRFILLDHDLTVEDGEITPSMKVKRRVVEKTYRKELDALYA